MVQLLRVRSRLADEQGAGAQRRCVVEFEGHATGLPIVNTLVAYMGQGWGVAVGLSLTAPEEQTEIEQKATQSGIEIARA